MEISEAQQKVDQWIKEYGGGYFSELTNLGILMEELGELSRWMVRKYGDQNPKESEKALVTQASIEDELSDILWVLICLANQMNIDLTVSFQKNISKKTLRDKDRHKNEE